MILVLPSGISQGFLLNNFAIKIHAILAPLALIEYPICLRPWRQVKLDFR